MFWLICYEKFLLELVLLIKKRLINIEVFEFLLICLKYIKFEIGFLKIVMNVFIGWVGVIRVYVLGMLLLYRIKVLFMILCGLLIGIINFGFEKFFFWLLLFRFLSIIDKFLIVYDLNFKLLFGW